MMRLRTIIPLFLFLFSDTVFAQTQQGYVKTLGRPNQKGIALSDVSVRVKGGHNAVLSNAEGTFQMPMVGKKNGDAYQLQQVQKQGYELNELGTIGRQYAFSDKVPLTIVMVSTRQLQADKQRIEDNAYRVAQKNYKAKLALLEKQKEDNTITTEQYRQQFQNLQDKFEKYQSLIDDLADHYAHVDYDDLDAKEQEINICIENGDLERADSLLQLLGIQQRAENIIRRLEAGQQLMDEALQDKEVVLKQQEKDGEYLYQLYTIALAKFTYEDASKYIEIRAELDSTNIEWQTDAEQFFYKQKDYSKNENFCKRLLSIYKERAKIDYHNYTPNVAIQLKSLADIYSETQREREGEELYLEAIKIFKSFAQEYPLTYEGYVAATLNSLGNLYNHNNNIQKSEIFLKESLELFREITKKHPSYSNDFAVGATLANIASLYLNTNRYDESEQMYNESIEILNELATVNAKEYEPLLCKAKIGLGLLYYKTHRLDQSEQLYLSSLEILKHFFLSNPHAYLPEIADVQQQLAGVYGTQLLFQKAEQCYYEALRIYDELGKSHPLVYLPKMADTKRGLARVYLEESRYSDAEQLFLSALDIYQKSFQTNPTTYSQLVADVHCGLAKMYYYMNRFSDSERHYLSALNIFRRLSNDDFKSFGNFLADVQYGLAQLYAADNKHKESEKLFLSVLKIYEDLSNLSQNYDYEISFVFYHLASLYKEIGRYEDSERFYLLSLEIRKKMFATNPEIAPYFYNVQEQLAQLYLTLNRYSESEELFTIVNKAYSEFALQNPSIYNRHLAYNYYNWGILKTRLKAYENAIVLLEKAIFAYKNIDAEEAEIEYYTERILEYLVFSYQNIGNNEKSYQRGRDLLALLRKKDVNEIKNEYYADIFANQAYYSILMNQFKEAEINSEEARQLFPSKIIYFSNLAAALLFQGRYSEAEQIYRQYKDELKDGFLEDFKQFAEAGVIPKEYEADVEKIKRMLNE